MSKARPPERTLWKGRPALRLMLLSPPFIAFSAAAAWLAARAIRPGRLPSRDAFIPLGLDSLRQVNWACVELAGALIIASTLAWMVLGRLATRYELTSQRLRLRSGLLVRVIDEVELYRIRDVRLVRGPFQILSGLGTVTVDSTDGTGTVRLGPIPRSASVRETLREASEEQKSVLGVRMMP